MHRRPSRENVVPHAAVVKSSTARADLTTTTYGTCGGCVRRPTERDGSGLWSYLFRRPAGAASSRA
jgi:hypothetical protein